MCSCNGQKAEGIVFTSDRRGTSTHICFAASMILSTSAWGENLHIYICIPCCRLLLSSTLLVPLPLHLDSLSSRRRSAAVIWQHNSTQHQSPKILSHDLRVSEPSERTREPLQKRRPESDERWKTARAPLLVGGGANGNLSIYSVRKRSKACLMMLLQAWRSW